jgi:hypothetical protein
VVATYPIKNQIDSIYDYVNTSTLDNNVGPSSCTSTDNLYGGYTDFSGSANPTGATGGVLSVSPAPDITAGSSWPPVISAPGCAFTGSGYYGSYNPYQARVDVAYIPGHDAFGNPTTGYKPSQTFTSGPYTGKIRTDSPLAIRYAAMNAADAVAQAMHSDTTYAPVVYSIGLSGNENIPMDTDFMERIANDLNASNYNSNQPIGKFELATDNPTLADAFNAIAGQILRISK